MRPVPRVWAGLAHIDLPGAVARSDRLFFHAALYSNFARNPAMAEALETALTRPTFTVLEVVSLDVTAVGPWRDEFFDVLRQDRFPGDMLADFAVSCAFLEALATRYPGKVHLFSTTVLPLAPILLLSDRVFVGHYLHGPIPAPDGFWLEIPADVPGLLRRAEAGIPPGPADSQASAVYRFVHECVMARDAARTGPDPFLRRPHATR